MEPQGATPKAIRFHTKRNLLEIDWSDGTTSRYDGAFLRLVCPCAGCRGHVPGEVPGPSWDDVQGVRIERVQGVGAYALQFTFTDRHATGIYSFEWLHRNAPERVEGVDEIGRPIDSGDEPAEGP
jgi:DUF971 family protein